MPRTPRIVSLTLGLGVAREVSIRGECLNIISLSAGTSIGVGFDDFPVEELLPGRSYQTKPNDPFQKLRFVNTTGGATVVVICVSDGPVSETTTASLAGLLAQLVLIQANTLATAGDTANIVLDTANLDVPLSDLTAGNAMNGGTAVTVGLAAVQLLSADPTAKKSQVEFDYDASATARLYVFTTNAVGAVNSFTKLVPGGVWHEDWNGDVWAICTEAAQTVRAYATK